MSATNIGGNVTLTSIGTGNLENPGFALLCGGRVGGDVKVASTTAKIYVGDEDSNGVGGEPCAGPETVGGNITFTNNKAEQLQISGSTVNGSVTATGNAPASVVPGADFRATEGEEDFANNKVAGDFICHNNTVNDQGDAFDIRGTVIAGTNACEAPTNLY